MILGYNYLPQKAYQQCFKFIKARIEERKQGLKNNLQNY